MGVEADNFVWKLIWFAGELPAMGGDHGPAGDW
jgi:hypothetical protein